MGTHKRKGSEAFAKNFKELLKDADKEALCKKLDLSGQTAFRQWCNGVTLPTADKLVIIAEHFDVSTDFLLGLSDVPTVDKTVQDICDLTGLSEKVVMWLMNYEVEIDTPINIGTVRGTAYGMTKAKPPKEINQIMESQFFRELYRTLWVLNNLRKEGKALPLHIQHLKALLSVKEFRRFCIDDILNELRAFLDTAAPYTFEDGDDVSNGMYFDGLRDIDFYMYKNRKKD